MNDTDKNWWAPIRNGLVTDPHAKHIKAMRSALPLYLYLHIFADREKGRLFRKYQTVSEDMGIPVTTLKKWMKRLCSKGYVELTSLGNGINIQITKFKPIRSTKSGTSDSSRSTKSDNEKYHFRQGEVPNPTRSTKMGTSSSDSKQKANKPRSTNNGSSKESLKERSKEREADSLNNSFKKTATKHPANPDIKIAIDHFHDEYLKIHGIKPQINGAACKTFQTLLNTRPVEQVKTLTTGYLSLDDEKLRDKGFPIQWMPEHINRLMMANQKRERGFVY